MRPSLGEEPFGVDQRCYMCSFLRNYTGWRETQREITVSQVKIRGRRERSPCCSKFYRLLLFRDRDHDLSDAFLAAALLQAQRSLTRILSGPLAVYQCRWSNPNTFHWEDAQNGNILRESLFTVCCWCILIIPATNILKREGRVRKQRRGSFCIQLIYCQTV